MCRRTAFRCTLVALGIALASAPAATRASTVVSDALVDAVRMGQLPSLPPLPATLPPAEKLPTLQRLSDNAGDDSALTSGSRPNPRALSNTFATGALRQDNVPLSNLAIAMLQLLASHEIARSPTGPDRVPIRVNDTETPNEMVFDGDITFSRSLSRDENGRPQQLNDVTSPFDGSSVYGSDLARMDLLREPGTPYLRVDPATGGLPRVEVSLPGGGTAMRAIAGDGRADENPVLEATHVLFLHEHNRIAGEIEEHCDTCDADDIFEAARYLVAKTQEKIFYEELLPTFLNARPGELTHILVENGIDTTLVAQVDRALNSFTAAAGRSGHTQVPDTILLQTPQGAARSVPLRDCFFDSDCLGEATLEDVLYGASVQPAEAIDTIVTDALRDAQRPGFNGLPELRIDLFATNIHRGRDHGLPDYFTMREILGFDAPETADDALALLPASVFTAYGVDLVEVTDFSQVEIDLLVGIFAEHRDPSRYMGETGRVLWALQFLGLSQEYERAGMADAMLASFGATPFSIPEMQGDPFAEYLEGVTMAGLLAANTSIAEGFWTESFTATPAPIPTPGSLSMIVAGLACLLMVRARRARSAEDHGFPGIVT
jgi:hypothetical protein